jgi:hypothetical protein
MKEEDLETTVIGKTAAQGLWHKCLHDSRKEKLRMQASTPVVAPLKVSSYN